MAKQFDKIVIPVELQVKDDGTAKELESKVKGLEKVAAKGLVYQIQLDNKNYADVIKKVSEISAIGDKVVFNFQENGLEKMGKDAKAFVETIKQAYNDALNPKNTQSGSSSGVVNGQLKSLEQVNAQIEQQKKRYNELQAEIKKYNDAQSKAAQKSAQAVKDSWNNYIKSDSAKDRKEFAKQFKAFSDSGFDKSLLDGKDPFGEVFNFEKYKQKYEKTLKSLPKNFNLEKEAKSVTDQFNLPFDNSQLQKYIEENNKLVTNIKELQKVKQELESAKKETTDGKTKVSDSTKTQEKTSENTQTGGYHQVKIEPANLEEFYGKIENHRAAKINVEVGNKDTIFSDLENKPVKVKAELDSSSLIKNNTENTTSNHLNTKLYADIVKRLNEQKNSSASKISAEMDSLLKGAADSGTALGNEQIKQLVALSKAYKVKTGEKSPLAGKLKDLGIKNFDDIIPGYGDIKKQFENVLIERQKLKSQKIKSSNGQTNGGNSVGEVQVDLIPSTKSIANLKSSIQSQLGEIPVDVKLNTTNVGDLQTLIAEEKNLLNSPTSPTNNAAYISQEDSLQRIIDLQKQVNEGNRNIAKTTDSVGKITTEMAQSGLAKGEKTTTKKAINDKLKEYVPATSNQKYKDELAALVASYKDMDNLKDTSFKKYPGLWTEISASIEKATASQKAYEEILRESANIKGSDLTKEETQAITDSLKSEDLGKVIKDSLNIGEAESSSGIESLKSSVNDLIFTIGTIGTTYQTSVTDVSAGADAQVQSINKVKSAITELGSSLELVGVKTLEELPQYKEQMAQIQAEQDKLAKEKEAFQKLKDKKTSGSGKGSKGKTDELTDTEKLKKAFEKTKGWTLDESSIQKQSNGIITYVAELEKAEGEAEKFLLTVGDVNEIITKTGTINKKDYLNKAQPLSPTTENIKVEGENDSSTVIEKTVDDITRLKEIASNTIGFKLDESSIVKADNGIISFKANLDGADGKVKELNYELESLSRVVNSKGEFTDSFLGKGKTDDELKAIEEQKKVLEAKAKQTETLNKLSSAADKTNNFVLNSSSIDSEGFIRFSGYIEEANGKVKELSFSVKELESVLGANGGLNSNFIDQANLTKIEETLAKFKTQTAENKTNEAVGIDNTEGLERARQLEAQINELIASGNISEEQRKATILEIAAAKAKEAELYKVSDPKNYSAQQSVETAKNNYNNVLSSIDFSNLNTGVAVFDQMSNEVVDVKTKMESLKATAAGLVDELSKGEFANKGAFEQTKQSLQETLTAMKELANNPIYQQTNKKGQTFWQTLFNGQNLNTMTTKDVEKGLTESLSRDYQKILKNVKYNASNKTATATVLNNGNVEKVTMSLNAYTDAAGRAQVAVHKLNQDEGTYVTSGQKWVDGIKGKIASLSQYVTGLTLVMRAWSEVKQGFNFVKELDSSLTTINQTMSATKDQLNDLGQGSIDAGKNLGSSAQDVLDAAAIYANANETTESVLEKAKPTVMLANASGGDISTASDQIQGVVNQFKELEGQEQRVVNSYEKISAGLAIDFAKLLAHKLEIIY